MLSPYRVLDLTTGGAMLCGQVFGDMGADVILVEPPGGSPDRRTGPFYHDDPSPGRSLWFWSLNRNKRSVTLDLDAAAGREAFLRLAKTADFVIESFPPGHLAARGLGYQQLAAVNPRLILVSITPFGQLGPKANWPATDLTALAASGVLGLTGDADRPPVRVTIPQAYLHAGAEALAGALIANAARERGGTGQHVDVSAQAAAMIATQNYLLSAGWGEVTVERVAGGAQIGPLYARFVYPCKDGHVSVTFLFGVVIGPFTRRLMEWMHDEGFVDDATRDKDWVGYVVKLVSGEEPVSELYRCAAAIERFTLTKTKTELFEASLTRGLLIVPITTARDVVESRQLAARSFWTNLKHDEIGETVRYPGVYARPSATPFSIRRRPPLAGEHTAEVLSEDRRSAGPGGGPREEAGSRPALEGLKVLDLTWVIVGPIGTRYLADYGATVVRVESTARMDPVRVYQPFKDGVPGVERSAQHANANAGKLGLSLNLSTEAGRKVLLDLVRWCDVLVENYSPRAMRSWGMTYESLRELNPGLIMLSTCLNGQYGPDSHLAGFGTMGAALSGFHHLTGWPDRPPAGPFLAYTDYLAPRFICAAILGAVDHRRRTGAGQYVDLSQAECAIAFLGPAILDYTVNGRVMVRDGNRSPGHAPHGTYPAAGGTWVAIACGSDEEWRGLCRAVDQGLESDPRFSSFSARKANEGALDEAVGAWTALLTADEIEQRLVAEGVPVHRVSTAPDTFADPQLAARGHYITVPNPELGPIVVEASRLVLSRTPAQVRWAGPVLGQHNEDVLRGILGMDDEAIGDLIAQGALE